MRFEWTKIAWFFKKELVETTGTDEQDQNVDLDAHEFSDENIKGNRPTLKRLSGNQLTDDSSDTETEDVDEDDETSSLPSATASCAKELEKSPKRPRPDTVRPSPIGAVVVQAPTPHPRVSESGDNKDDDDQKAEEEKKKDEGTNSSETRQTTESGAPANDGTNNTEPNPNNSTATER